LMDPAQGENNAPPIFQFEWGLYTFTGLLDSYKETIDFFASDGVPLRAAVNITMSSQTDVFNEVDPSQAKRASVVATPMFDSVTKAATQGGDPKASRALASANSLESLRFTAGATLTVDASVQLKPPVAFATAPSGGAGMGIGVGLGLSVGGGVSAGAGISFGGSASAGVPATGGAFAGLRVPASTSAQFNLDVSRMQHVSSSDTDFTTDSSATFSVGGRASMKSSDGLSAEVGTSRSLRNVIKFEE
jgi:Contractile injection system tube protein